MDRYFDSEDSRVLDGVAVLEILHEHRGSAVSGEILNASILLRAPLLKLKIALTITPRKVSKVPFSLQISPRSPILKGRRSFVLQTGLRT